MQQFTGRDVHGEYLVTVYPAEGARPARAEAAFRPTEWDTWGAPVCLDAVPAFKAVAP